MKSRWTRQGEEEATARWGGSLGEDFALRLYFARLLGDDPELVLHGGGNVSFKGTRRTLFGDQIESLYVKASGADLAVIDAPALPALDLARLRRLESLNRLDDRMLRNELRLCLFDSDAPTPSIETIMHALLPPRFVDHSHANAVLVVTHQPGGDEIIREILGNRVAYVPYLRPGLELAKAVAAAYRANPGLEGVVLARHGLVTFANDARTSYEAHIAMVEACEQYIARKRRTRAPGFVSPSFCSVTKAQELAVKIAPLLRGALAEPTGDEDQPFRRSVMEWRCSEEILAFLAGKEAGALCAAGCVTADHAARTRSWPLFLMNTAWDSEDRLAAQVRESIEAFRRRHTPLAAEWEKRHFVDQSVPTQTIESQLFEPREVEPGTIEPQEVEASTIEPRASARADLPFQGIEKDLQDPTCRMDGTARPYSPRVVLVPGAGAFCWGRTKREAQVIADITEQSLRIKTDAYAIGGFEGLGTEHLLDAEFRLMQAVKDQASQEAPLAGQVVIISGGAGAIGIAIGETCIQAGAHVVLADLDEQRCRAAAKRIEKQCGRGSAIAVVMDVTSEADVARGYEQAVRAYGGVDVIVPNAGIACVAPIEDLKARDFKRVLDVNALGYFLFMREGIRLLKRQGLGGHVIINASKNVFAPGRDFAAYSASKAAGHQLGKVAAIELAAHGIRVNMINADAVFGDEQTPSGLWACVGPDRAKSRGIAPEDLPEYYRERNLLKARVRGRHVGRAVVFFASNATPTTGATLPVDGGVVEAFPR